MNKDNTQLEKVYEFRTGDKFEGDCLKSDLVYWFSIVGDDYDQEYNPKMDEMVFTILRDFTITVKLDYPPTTD